MQCNYNPNKSMPGGKKNQACYSEGLVLPLPLASDAEKKQLDVRNFGHIQPLTEINILYGNNYKTRQTKLTNLTLPSCLTNQFIWLNKKVKKK